MTILLFLASDLPFLVLDSDQPPGTLSASINANLWQPNAELRTWLQTQGFATTRLKLCASQHDNLVIVTPYSAPLPAARSPHLPDCTKLTRRQREIMQGLISGKTGRQIAAQLGLHHRTVIWHINRLKKLFNAQTLAQSVSQMAALDPLIRPIKKH